MRLFLTLLALLGLASCTNYDGYKVYKVSAVTEQQNQVLLQLQGNPQFDFWSRINKVGNPVTVMASPQVQQEFERTLNSMQISYDVEIQNVERTIEIEREYHRSRPRINNGRLLFDKYLRHEEINDYLAELARNYSDIVSVSTIGVSYFNRTVDIIRISSGPGATPKPVVFIEAGNHAREWISPELSLYIINQLVENPQNRPLFKEVDWIVLPLLNPDGYEFTWESNRMWRKTRSPGAQCTGTDGNRNFGFHWMEKGASSEECSETYAGPEAFSEPEAGNLRDILDATDNIKAFISLHSYGQLLFYPYSYDEGVVPDNWLELEILAVAVNNVISSVNGTQYVVGASTDILYPAAGCTDDWAMGAAGIDIVYVFELPGGGNAGFDLPPADILRVSIETWEGIKVISRYVAEKYRN